MAFHTCIQDHETDGRKLVNERNGYRYPLYDAIFREFVEICKRNKAIFRRMNFAKSRAETK